MWIPKFKGNAVRKISAKHGVDGGNLLFNEESTLKPEGKSINVNADNTLN